MNIPIPDLFDVYNRKSNYTLSRPDAGKLYADLTAGGGKAGDCVECGGCEGHCPQHLEIRELLKKVARSFERH